MKRTRRVEITAFRWTTTASAAEPDAGFSNQRSSQVDVKNSSVHRLSQFIETDLAGALIVSVDDARSSELTQLIDALLVRNDDTPRAQQVWMSRNRSYSKLRMLGLPLRQLKTRLNILRHILLPILLLFATSGAAVAQTTTFTYQGRLTDGGTVVNGNYDFQFALFDTNTVGTGTQQGTTVIVSNVTVTGGVFVVQLDFGAGVFTGANRFIEIAVKQTSATTYTTLGPRQPLTSTPYSIRSLKAATADGLSIACVSCITSSQIQSVLGSAVSGAIPVASIPAGSTNYIQNQNAAPQDSSNFNISGTGTATTLNAVSQYNLNGARILSNPGNLGSNNLFVGVGAGAANTGTDNAFFGRNAGFSNIGLDNSIFGTNAGFSNTTGSLNSFFGRSAGQSNSNGTDNSFFGAYAGFSNTTGFNNSFFGRSAGQSNTTASENSFFGNTAGFSNTTGAQNSFFGDFAGNANLTGNNNSFFGANAGTSNTTGGSNSFFGDNAGQNNTIGSDNSFFGTLAGQNNTGLANSFFGRSAGQNSATGPNNSFFGMSAGFSNTAGGDNSFFGTNAGQNNTTGFENSFFGRAAGPTITTGQGNTALGFVADFGANNLSNATAIGWRARVDCSNCLVLGSVNGINSAPFDTKVGIGTTGPAEKLTVKTATSMYGFIHTDGTVTVGSFVGGSTGGGWYGTKSNHPLSFFVNDGSPTMTIATSGNVGIGTPAPQRLLHVNGRARVGSIPLEASFGSVCFNQAGDLLQCGASSLRWKTNVQPFLGGLDIVRRLRPISFNWKEGGQPDIGLGAEDVARLAPSLTLTNSKGEPEGVKYDRLGVVLVNAVIEQQAQIEQQRKQIESLKKRVYKYLYPSFVESPDMKDIYDGVVVLDSRGEAVVKLPEWFEALNTDFRYQLTPIGAPGPYLHIAAKVANSLFKIAGGTGGMEVSWQVTGIRQDAYANAK